jgi:membrane protease subunit (stomatin/prohibitin family)
MMARSFSHPNFGTTVRIEVNACEVRLIFVANNRELANDMAENLLAQLRRGGLSLNMMGGKPISMNFATRQKP